MTLVKINLSATHKSTGIVFHYLPLLDSQLDFLLSYVRMERDINTCVHIFSSIL